MNKISRKLWRWVLLLAIMVPLQATVIQFNGAIDLTFIDWGEDGPRSGNPYFDVYEVYLLGRADLTEDLSGYFELRSEHSGEAILRQGYIKWMIAEPLHIDAGYFYMPIGQYWVTYYASTRKLATYAYPMRLINVTPWSEAGIMVEGKVPKLNYRIAVVNGLNQNYIDGSKPRDARQGRDNNWNKMVGGRVGLVPVDQIEMGFSYVTGKYDDATTRDVQFLDADFSVDVADLSIRGEWVQSTADDSTGTDEITSSGYYAHVAYKILKNTLGLNYIEPVVRYEFIDPGRTMSDRFAIGPQTTGSISAITGGINISPRQHFLVKFEYRMTTEELDPQLENDAIAVQCCIDF
jgi:hypothetical protein